MKGLVSWMLKRRMEPIDRKESRETLVLPLGILNQGVPKSNCFWVWKPQVSQDYHSCLGAETVRVLWVECAPTQIHTEVLSHGNSEDDLICSKTLAEVLELGWDGQGDPKCSSTGLPLKGRQTACRNTHGRGKGTERGLGHVLSSQSSSGNKLTDPLILDFYLQNCETIQSLVEASQFVVFCYNNTRIWRKRQKSVICRCYTLKLSMPCFYTEELKININKLCMLPSPL